MKDVIVITGGSNGLGKALVEYSLNKGLIVCNLDEENLEFSENQNVNTYGIFLYVFFILPIRS